MAEPIVIPLGGTLDYRGAESAAARIRAAMRTGEGAIVLEAAPDLRIASAEFLGFLAVASTHLSEHGRRLVLRGCEGAARTLMRITALDTVLTMEEI